MGKPLITFEQKGDFSKTYGFLKRAKKLISMADLEKYGRLGVEALMAATPVDTGLTASSWYYKIENTDGKISISFCNSNIQDRVPIAVIIQYGHATGTGAWIEGRDYINPAIKPVFDDITKSVWEEVTKK